MLGKQIGWPYSMNHSRVTDSLPSNTSATSVLVPPMSKPIALSKPHSVPRYFAATAPAAMPEPARRAPWRSMVFGVITPPPLCSNSRSLR